MKKEDFIEEYFSDDVPAWHRKFCADLEAVISDATKDMRLQYAVCNAERADSIRDLNKALARIRLYEGAMVNIVKSIDNAEIIQEIQSTFEKDPRKDPTFEELEKLKDEVASLKANSVHSNKKVAELSRQNIRLKGMIENFRACLNHGHRILNQAYAREQVIKAYGKESVLKFLKNAKDLLFIT